ncbi:PIR Superfamily Protein [Plasmodium ovale wallikeri]|uniref:PIR Superfamily Protein n=1 Tax=Plasmodium ovale wallikeri TaxID=864142 RepID=A0A1A9APK7_PLAOA|nr:PIR Superfamily Protein [Plasmodium ovale wallikeri]
MEISDTNNCELPSEKYYRKLDNDTKTTTYGNYCDSNENIVSGEHPLSILTSRNFVINFNIGECNINHSPIGIDYLKKWKIIYDYSLNYEHVKCAFQTDEDCSENCKEDYCRYILSIFNIYKGFEHICSNATINQRCPYFWKDFQKNYSETSHIESKCKDVYDKLGFYKVKMYFGELGIEEYIEQYESTYMFSFFEKLIGYSIKYYLSKTIHY